MDQTTKEWFDSNSVVLRRDPTLLGWHTDEELIKLSGAPKGSTVVVSVIDTGIELRVDNPELLAEPMVRVVAQDESGYVFHILNAAFVLNPALLGKGIGPRSISIELFQALELNLAQGVSYISRVRTQAVGDWANFDTQFPLRGYYVWPMMGFDADVPKALLSHPSLPKGLGDNPRLLDLLDTEEGEAFWLEHGSTLWVEFDLTPGSTSWKRHNRYTVERKIEVQS